MQNTLANSLGVSNVLEMDSPRYIHELYKENHHEDPIGALLSFVSGLLCSIYVRLRRSWLCGSTGEQASQLFRIQYSTLSRLFNDPSIYNINRWGSISNHDLSPCKWPRYRPLPSATNLLSLSSLRIRPVNQ